MVLSTVKIGPAKLKATEERLLTGLGAPPDQVLDRDQLLQVTSTRTLDVDNGWVGQPIEPRGEV